MAIYKVHQYYEYRSSITVEAESPDEARDKVRDIIDKFPARYVGHTDMKICDIQGEVLKIY